MTFVVRRKDSRKAGRSALKEFRARRRRILRENWRDWLIVVTFIACCSTLAVMLESRPAALIFAGLGGAGFALAVFGWMLGGNVTSLPWLRELLASDKPQRHSRGSTTHGAASTTSNDAAPTGTTC